MSGWFSVKRGITSHEIFKGKPERLAIWLWLLDNAVWQDTPHDINGNTITVKRGSVAASERRIAADVGVGYQVVRTFIARLKSERMINTEVTHGKNVITLCNWEKYQNANARPNAATNAALTQDQRTKEQGNKETKKVFRAVAERFDDFWEAYPHRGGTKKGKAPAKAKYDAAVASGVAEQSLIDAAKRYTHDKSVRDGYARDPSTWLNQKGWEDEIDTAPLKAINGGAPKYGDMRQRADGSWETYHSPFDGWMRTHV